MYSLGILISLEILTHQSGVANFGRTPCAKELLGLPLCRPSLRLTRESKRGVALAYRISN